MFGSIKVVLILMLLAGAGGAYTYVTNLQKTAEIHRLNAERLEVAQVQYYGWALKNQTALENFPIKTLMGLE